MRAGARGCADKAMTDLGSITYLAFSDVTLSTFMLDVELGTILSFELLHY